MQCFYKDLTQVLHTCTQVFYFFIYIYFYEDVMKVLCVHCFCEDGEDFVCTLLMKTA